MKEQMGDENMQPTPGIEGNMDYVPGQQMEMENGGLGFPGDGRELPPGATFDSINENFLGGLKENMKKQNYQKVLHLCLICHKLNLHRLQLDN